MDCMYCDLSERSKNYTRLLALLFYGLCILTGLSF